MLKIGLFSKLSRVSIRMLRYYDEIGLLVPEETDPWTCCTRRISIRSRITAITARISCRRSAGSRPCGTWAFPSPTCAA